MDMVKTGAFLAQLRKEARLTQEELGVKIGVTNKTVSRWETGTYLPPVEMLAELSRLYGVSINELLSGEKLSAVEYREKAEENLVSALSESVFSLRDKRKYFMDKWRHEHIAAFILGFLLWSGLIAFMLIRKLRFSLVCCIAALTALALYALFYNLMTVYTEKHLFGH